MNKEIIKGQLVNYRENIKLFGRGLDENAVVPCMALREGNYPLFSHNCLPRGVEELKERVSRPEKYTWIEHAERNLIYEAARKGESLEGSTFCLLWFPCAECARAIIQCGCKAILVDENDLDNPRYKDYKFKEAKQMLIEAGIKIHNYGTNSRS